MEMPAPTQPGALVECRKTCPTPPVARTVQSARMVSGSPVSALST